MELVTIKQFGQVQGMKDGGDLVPRHGRDGRPKIFPEGGGKGAWYTRTTTFIDCLDDKSNLTDWKMRKLLLGLDMRPTLMDEYRQIEDPEGADKRSTKTLIERAMKIAGIEDKADIGTAMHTLTEEYDSLEDFDMDDVPPDVKPDLQAYAEATTGLLPVALELFCVLDEYQVAGTFDRLYEVRDPELADELGVEAGALLVGDIKTGGVDYGLGKIAMQLAAYQMMERYDPVTGKRSPLAFDGKTPNDEVALIIHLPAGEGRCRIIPVDIRKGREGLALASQVREWRKHWARKASKREPVIDYVSVDLTS